MKIARSVAVLLTISSVSLATNGYLAWRSQKDQQLFHQSLLAKNSQLLSESTKNRKLGQENQQYKSDITKKDQELEEKITELAKKQDELNDLSKQLETKKKELDTKIADLASAQKRVDDQKSQLESNTSELAKLRERPPLFSFAVKTTTLSDAEAKKAAVKQVVTDAYDTIAAVYGKPYLLHSVTISFVDTFSNDKASGEIVITNSDKGLDIDIHLKDFDRNSFNDVNTVIHETIHAFHGLSALVPTAFEEGITVATTDIVMEKMIAASQLPHFSPLYIRLSDAEFSQKQQTMSIPRDTNTFYTSDSVADYYQVLGKAWYDLYKNDNTFFKKFNEALYSKKNAGQEITEDMVLGIIKEIAPTASLTGAAWQLH